MLSVIQGGKEKDSAEFEMPDDEKMFVKYGEPMQAYVCMPDKISCNVSNVISNCIVCIIILSLCVYMINGI